MRFSGIAPHSLEFAGVPVRAARIGSAQGITGNLVRGLHDGRPGVPERAWHDGGPEELERSFVYLQKCES